MKKILFFTLIIFTLLFLGCGIFLLTVGINVEEETVYLSNDQRDEIYQTMVESCNRYDPVLPTGVYILKESITPTYSIDLSEVVRTGEIHVVPYEEESKNASDGSVYCKRQFYYAKTLTATGEFGGNYWLTIKDDGAFYSAYAPTSVVEYYSTDCDGKKHKVENFAASYSYADHAERIRALLGKEEIIPAEDVKLIYLKHPYYDKGPYFYIESEQVLVPVGLMAEDPDSTRPLMQDEYLTLEDLKTMAEQDLKAYEEELARKEAWKEEFPEVPYAFNCGSTFNPHAYLCSRVDNVTDIAGYLDLNMTVKQSDMDRLSVILGYVSLGLAVVGGGLITFLATRSKQKAKTACAAAEQQPPEIA